MTSPVVRRGRLCGNRRGVNVIEGGGGGGGGGVATLTTEVGHQRTGGRISNIARVWRQQAT